MTFVKTSNRSFDIDTNTPPASGGSNWNYDGGPAVQFADETVTVPGFIVGFNTSITFSAAPMIKNIIIANTQTNNMQNNLMDGTPMLAETVSYPGQFATSIFGVDPHVATTNNIIQPTEFNLTHKVVVGKTPHR